MATDKVKKNVFNEVPGLTIVIWAILSALFLIGAGISYLVQTNTNDQQVRQVRQNVQYNVFVDSLAQNKNLFELETPAWYLYNDLKLFENTDKVDVKFYPQSLEQINILPNAYPGVGGQVGCILIQDLETGSCGNYGFFSADFVRMYQLIETTDDISSFYRSTKPADLNVYVYPFDIAWYEFFLLLLLICNLITTLVYPLFIVDRYYNEYKLLSAKEIPWYKGLFFAFPLYFFAVAKDCSRNKETKKIARQEKEEQDARLLNNPLRAELESCQLKLKKLETLYYQYPSDAIISKALKACREVVKELETFPNKVSQKTARYLALEVQQDLQNTKNVMTSKLDAIDEIERLT